jgi:hypothetical protein
MLQRTCRPALATGSRRLHADYDLARYGVLKPCYSASEVACNFQLQGCFLYPNLATESRRLHLAKPADAGSGWLKQSSALQKSASAGGFVMGSPQLPVAGLPSHPCYSALAIGNRRQHNCHVERQRSSSLWSPLAGAQGNRYNETLHCVQGNNTTRPFAPQNDNNQQSW